MKEIERKFLVKSIDLSKYIPINLEQAYLNIAPDPIIRIRKYENSYFLTYKSKIHGHETLNIADEYELPINEQVYNNLLPKCINNLISKKRYLIKINNNLTAEVDEYSNKLSGLFTVEVEFETEEKAKAFKPLVWFGEEITEDRRYINSQLSKINNIKELEK